MPATAETTMLGRLPAGARAAKTWSTSVPRPTKTSPSVASELTLVTSATAGVGASWA
ncbi:hypothetical protein ACOBQX_15390 [Actinokineospora sp. G85]|uniref:hypothetical protein n=1 Tax=Actinokineospora sp. G85 TaxID=3406626 RepID=UPI003C714157